MSMKKTLKKLVATGEIEEAMRILLDYLEKGQQPNPLLNTAIALSSRYNASKKQLLNTAKDSNEESNEIIKTLLSLIDRIDDIQPDTVPVDSDDRNSIIQKITSHLALNSSKLATLLYLLSNTPYDWRKQLTLIGKTGWTADELDDLANRYPEFIQRHQRADKIVLYAVQASYKDQLKRLISEGRTGKNEPQ